MATAAVTPRVRTLVICDDVSASLTEAGVFTLEGVRLHLTADSLPRWATLSVFLLLSSPRKGRYQGKILIISERTEKPIRYIKFLAQFEGDNELLPLYVEIGDCRFPNPGQYRFEVHFSTRRSAEVQKGEHPFFMRLSDEE